MPFLHQWDNKCWSRSIINHLCNAAARRFRPGETLSGQPVEKLPPLPWHGERIAIAETTGPDAPETQREALSKGIAWFDAVAPSDVHQDKFLRLLLAVRRKQSRESMQATVDGLLALLRADGGWSQTVPEPNSDAFATGQSRYTLSLVGDAVESSEIKRGIDFLLAAQAPDGSWPMISRSTPGGSPGSATLLTPITYAASSWATLGLTHCAPRTGRRDD